MAISRKAVVAAGLFWISTGGFVGTLQAAIIGPGFWVEPFYPPTPVSARPEMKPAEPKETPAARPAEARKAPEAPKARETAPVNPTTKAKETFTRSEERRVGKECRSRW